MTAHLMASVRLNSPWSVTEANGVHAFLVLSGEERPLLDSASLGLEPPLPAYNVIRNMHKCPVVCQQISCGASDGFVCVMVSSGAGGTGSPGGPARWLVRLKSKPSQHNKSRIVDVVHWWAL